MIQKLITSDPKVEQDEVSSLTMLLDRLGDSLWKEGKHRINVFSFVQEANEILLGRRFRSFEYSDLEKIQETLRARGNSVATINRKTMALSKLLRAAQKAGAIKAIPEFRRLIEPPERIRFLTRQEERSLFGHIHSLSTEYYELSVVLVDTGAKIGEMIDLKWEDIPHKARQIRLSHGKGKHERTIPMTSRVAKILTSMERTSAQGPFRNVRQYKYRAVWNLAKARAGLGNDEGIVPYVLRHTCASRLVQGGVDLRRVQLWLGHRTLQMTMRYDYLTSNDLEICASVLDAQHS